MILLVIYVPSLHEFSFNCIQLHLPCRILLSIFSPYTNSFRIAITAPFSYPPTVGPQGHDLFRLGGPPAKSLTRDPDRKCEKVRARPSLGTNKVACIPTHGGSHISASCMPRRVHETTHRQRLPLTDPRIHEWSVGYQWAARCYPHALSTGALSTLHLHFRACSRSHAIARARLRRVATTEKATMRTHEITRRDHVTFFSLVSSVSFFLSRARAGKERRSHAGLRPRRSCMRAYLRALLHGLERRERERESPPSSWERLSRGRAKTA